MAVAAYLLENAMLVLALGRVFAHLWGFWMNRPAPPWGTGSLSKKKRRKKKKEKEKCPGEGGMGTLGIA